MFLTLLGTGCPKVDHNRFGPSNLISGMFLKYSLLPVNTISTCIYLIIDLMYPPISYNALNKFPY